MAKKTQKVLIKHEKMTVVPEHYTYIDDNGNEQKYSGIISKSKDTIIGKTFDISKVELQFHPGVVTVVGVPEYFTYVGKSGVESIYEDKVHYDEEKNCYVGTILEKKITNTPVDIFEIK